MIDSQINPEKSDGTAQVLAISLDSLWEGGAPLCGPIHGIKIDVPGMSVTAEVGLVPNGQGGFQLEAILRTKLPDSLPREVGRELIEATHQVCPYSNATRGNIPVELLAE